MITANRSGQDWINNHLISSVPAPQRAAASVFEYDPQFAELIPDTISLRPVPVGTGLFALNNTVFDGDGDTVADCFDNCPATANTKQDYADGDGTGDVCDACTESMGRLGPLHPGGDGWPNSMRI